MTDCGVRIKQTGGKNRAKLVVISVKLYSLFDGVTNAQREHET